LRNVLFILAACSFFSLKAQVDDPDYVLQNPRDYNKDPARSSNFIELFGNGGLYSLNIDYIYYYKEKVKSSVRGGVMVYPNGYYIEQGYVLENNFIFLPNPHHLEIGPGLTLQRKFNQSCTDSLKFQWESVWFGMLRVGYRYQKQDDGLFFRFGLTPIFYRKTDCGTDSPILDGGNWFWAGASIGLSF
jgi:hypothetical protein